MLGLLEECHPLCFDTAQLVESKLELQEDPLHGKIFLRMKQMSLWIQPCLQLTIPGLLCEPIK